MKRKLLVIISLCMMIFSTCAYAARFTDVPENHWAYSAVEEMAEKGVINGMGDGTFNPGGEITREQFAKLITVCLYGDSTSTASTPFSDVEASRWSEKYIGAALASGIITESDFSDGLFEPAKAMDRGTVALWIARGMGADNSYECSFTDVYGEDLRNAVGFVEYCGITKGYPDGTYKPTGTLTRAEAAEFIRRLSAKCEARTEVRTDSAQKVEFADNVVLVKSSSSTNVITSAEEGSSCISFDNIDATVENLSKGDILYIPACDAFENGFVGKVDDISANGSSANVKVSSPAMEEVIKSIDVSRIVAPTAEDFEEVDGITVSSPKTRAVGNVYNEHTETDKDGKLLSWSMELYETPSANPISLTYKSGNMTFNFNIYITALIDIKSSGFMLDVKDLSMKALVNTEIIADASYENSFKAGTEIKLPKAVMPVAGPIAVTITPKLTVDVSGELKITADLSLENEAGIIFENKKLTKVFETKPPEINIDAKAKGRLEIGPAVDIKLGLIETPLLKNADLLEGSFGTGLYITCNEAIKRTYKLKLEEGGIAAYRQAADENGVIHECTLCFDGEYGFYDRYKIGLSSEIKELLKKYADIEVKDFSGNLPDFKLGDWYCSAIDPIIPEFGLGACPHKLYKTIFTARDYYTGYPLANTGISVQGDSTYWTDTKGNAEAYLHSGKYNTTLVCEKYEKSYSEFTVKDKAQNLDQILKPLVTDNATDTDRNASYYLVRAKAPDSNLYGYVDVRTGYFAIEPRFDKADEAFGEDGWAYVKIGKYPSVINTNGKELFDFGTLEELSLDKNGFIQIPKSDTSIYLFNGSRFVKDITPPSAEITRIDTGGAYINGESRTPTKLIVIRGYTADKKMYYMWYDENGNFIYMTTEKCNMAKDIDCYYCITENKVLKIGIDGSVTEILSDKGSYIGPVVYSGYRWFSTVHLNSLSYRIYSNGFTALPSYNSGRGYGLGADNGIVVTIMPQSAGWTYERYYTADGTEFYRSSKSDGFYYGYAKVSYGSKRENGKWTPDNFFGYIDSDGNELLTLDKASIDNYSNPLKDGYYIYKEKGLFGIKKLDGTAVMWPAYKELYDMK